jgi:hypothetical protein
VSGIGDLQLFEYEASYWSRGDRLHLTFDAEDSAELAECLEPLGCEWLAKEILATEETAAAVTLEGVPASYDLFGTIVTFTFAEDEGLEHLTALHLAAADGIEAKLLGLPAARRVGRRRSDSDRENPAAITRATPRKKRRSPPEYLWEVADGATRVRSP